MLPLSEDDLVRMGDIYAYGQRSVRHLGTLDEVGFASDEKTFDSVVRCLAIVGEAAWKLSKPAQERYNQVPWILIAGMRHRLVHDYGEVDSSIAYKAVKKHIPSLLDEVKLILKEHGQEF